MSEEWLDDAIARADAANASDSRTVELPDGSPRPFELAYADRLEHWIRRLVPEPSAALRFAARAQHLRRWEIPRARFDAGRAGYHAWRRALQSHHAVLALEILDAVGCPPDTRARVEAIVRKRDRESNPDVQTMQDALGLTTLELQLDELVVRLDPAKIRDVLRRTIAKMSTKALGLAGSVPMSPRAAAALDDAVRGEPSGHL